MSKENKSRFAILGMLSLSPMSGYDLRKIIESSVGHFWNESYPQIYPMLKQLTEEGLTTNSVIEQQGKPDRYIYTLTDAGWKELEQWLSEPFEYQVQRNELLLKLFFGRYTSPAVSSEHVRRHRAVQEQLLRTYEQIEEQVKEQQRDNPHLTYWLLTVSMGKHVAYAMIAWCDEALTALQKIQQDVSLEKVGQTEER